MIHVLPVIVESNVAVVNDVLLLLQCTYSHLPIPLPCPNTHTNPLMQGEEGMHSDTLLSFQFHLHQQ